MPLSLSDRSSVAHYWLVANYLQPTTVAPLKSGKTIAEIVAAQHLDLAKVKQVILTQLKTQSDAAVQNGKMSQAMADQMYTKLSNGLDALATQQLLGK